MTLIQQILQLPWWSLVALVVAATWIAQRGWWRSDALRAAPSRRIGLGMEDLLIGGALLLGGMMVGGSLIGRYQDEPLTAFVLALIAGQLLSLGLPGAYLALRAARSEGGLRRIGILPRQPKHELKIALIGGLLALMIVPGVIVVFAIIGLLFGIPAPPLAHELLLKLQDSHSAAATSLLCVSAIVIAPLLEETVYRGLWQSLLVEALGAERRRSAIMLAAIVFASVHLGSVNWQALPALWVLALMLGWVYERTGSLLPGVVIHVLFNASNITFVLLTAKPNS